MIDLSGLPSLLMMQWLPEEASSFAPDVDWVFWFIMWLSVFFFVLIVALMVWFALKYRRVNPGDPFPENVSSHSTALELTWSIIPSILILFIFWWGFKAWIDMYTPPTNAEHIGVRASKWQWEFTYSNGATSSTELYVPYEKPVVLTMRSDDVLHAFYVPAFRTKQDVVPGRYTRLWFKPTKLTGNGQDPYRFYCAEYCGTGHSIMKGHVHVLAPEAYKEQLAMLASDVTRVLVAGNDGSMQVQRVQAGKAEVRGSGGGVHGAAPTAMRMSPDTSWALTGDAEGKIGLWALTGLSKATTAEPATLGHGDAKADNGVTAFAISDRSEYAFVGHTNGSISAWGLAVAGAAPMIKQVLANAAQQGGAILNLELLRNGGKDYLLAISADGTIRIYRLGTSTEVSGISAPTLEQVAELKHTSAFSCAGTLGKQYILAASGNAAALFGISWPVNSGGGAPAISHVAACSFATHTGPINTCRLLMSSGGAIFGVTASNDGTFKVWRVDVDANGAITGATETDSVVGTSPGPVQVAELTVDSRYVLAVTAGSTDIAVYELDFSSGKTSARGTIVAAGAIGRLAVGRGKSPIQSGYELYLAKCSTCHSLEGKAMACPPFHRESGGLWGSTRNVRNKDGSTVTINPVGEDYIRQSILMPDSQISDGGGGGPWPGTMSNFNELTPRDIDDLIAWFRTGPVVPNAGTPGTDATGK
ncbi:MAG: cytochrome c oxidase subunit II [Planctomycetota bacterium]